MRFIVMEKCARRRVHLQRRVNVSLASRVSSASAKNIAVPPRGQGATEQPW